MNGNGMRTLDIPKYWGCCLLNGNLFFNIVILSFSWLKLLNSMQVILHILALLASQIIDKYDRLITKMNQAGTSLLGYY